MLLFCHICLIIRESRKSQRPLNHAPSWFLAQTHRTMRLAKAGAIFGSLTQTHRTMRLAKAGAIFGSLTQTHRTMRLAKAGAIFGSLTQTHRTMRLAKAGAIFGSLRCRIWNEHSIKLTSKLLSCLMMSSLLYGYTQLGYQISKVEQFYLWCLCHMLHVVWHPSSSTLQHWQYWGNHRTLAVGMLYAHDSHAWWLQPEAATLWSTTEPRM